MILEIPPKIKLAITSLSTYSTGSVSCCVEELDILACEHYYSGANCLKVRWGLLVEDYDLYFEVVDGPE